MLTLRKATDRGYADHGWLQSWHSFSFADYYDAQHMDFGRLRVINDDLIAPDNGFGMHGHRDMEIISYVLQGELSHRDSMGNGSVIRPGAVQRMSAGKGVLHSEYNHGKDVTTHLLLIWILPAKTGGAPSYEEKIFSDEEKQGRLRLVATDGRLDPRFRDDRFPLRRPYTAGGRRAETGWRKRSTSGTGAGRRSAGVRPAAAISNPHRWRTFIPIS